MTAGVDVSRWQGAVDWAQVAAAGVAFAYINASNQAPDVHHAGATAAGLTVGLYYRADPRRAATVEADMFAAHINRIAGAGAGQLPPCLDLEDGDGDLASWAKVFLARLRERTGARRVAIYSGAWFFANRIRETWMDDDIALWIADYNAPVGQPRYLTDRVAIHQHSNTGLLPGVVGHVDLNHAIWPLPQLLATGAEEPPMMLTWLPAALRDGGLSVTEIPGWQTRGHGEMQPPRGVLLHHTAGAAAGLYPSLAVVRDGRVGLAGPLAHLGLARDGTWLVIAAGLAWHAGAGGPLAGVPRDRGNDYLIAVEAESVGTRDDWTAAQRDSYPRGVAALLRHLALPADRAVGHKEWAPTRKIDPAFWDMPMFRAAVAAHLEDTMSLTPEQDRLLREVHALLAWTQNPDLANPGTVGNAAASSWIQMFFGSPDFGPSITSQLKDLRTDVAALHGGAGVIDVGALAEAVADKLAARLKD